MTDLEPNLRRILSMVLSNDPEAHREVRNLAVRLNALADQLEARSKQTDPWKAPGGMGDRVKISVTTPAGIVTTKDTAPPDDHMDGW